MKERNKGIFYITLAAFCFAMMSLFVRLSGDLPPMQKAFFRTLSVAFVWRAVILWKDHILLKVPREDWIYLFLRVFCGTAGLIC